jgi:hypothetical protein
LRFSIPFVLPSLAVAASAQLGVEASFTAGTDLVCTAQSEWQTPAESRRPRGTDLSLGLELTASQSGLGSATATAAFALRRDVREVVATITESATGSSPFYAGATTGSHDTLLRLRSPVAITVRLTIATSSDVRWPGAVYSAEIDVGDDGRIELAATRDRTSALDLMVQIGPGDLLVRTRTALGSGAVHDDFAAQGSTLLRIVALDDISFAFTTDTDVRLEAAPESRTVPRGWNLWPQAGEDLDLFGSRGVSFKTTFTAERDGLHACADEAAYAAFGTSVALSVHDMLLTLRAPSARMLRVELAIDDRRDGYGVVHWAAAIDADDDGVFDLASLPGQRVARTILVAVGPNGARVRTRSGGAVTGTRFRGTIDIRVRPAAECTATVYGVACPGHAARLAGRVGLQNALELDIDSSLSNSLGKMIFGIAAIDRPLPFSPCRLYTEPIVALPLATDARGSAQQTLPVPSGISLDLYAQCLLLVQSTPLALTATNGIAVRCR